VIVAFYPADFSPVCTNEMALVQEVLDDIHGRQAELIGISVDGIYCHRAFAEKNHITFPLLADFWPHGAVSERYGVFRDDDGLSDRALFFVDAGGLLQGSWIAEEPGIAPGLNVIFEGLAHLRPEQARHAG
jgi:peroxiredoxin